MYVISRKRCPESPECASVVTGKTRARRERNQGMFSRWGPRAHHHCGRCRCCFVGQPGPSRRCFLERHRHEGGYPALCAPYYAPPHRRDDKPRALHSGDAAARVHSPGHGPTALHARATQGAWALPSAGLSVPSNGLLVQPGRQRQQLHRLPPRQPRNQQQVDEVPAHTGTRPATSTHGRTPVPTKAGSATSLRP